MFMCMLMNFLKRLVTEEPVKELRPIQRFVTVNEEWIVDKRDYTTRTSDELFLERLAEEAMLRAESKVIVPAKACNPYCPWRNSPGACRECTEADRAERSEAVWRTMAQK